MANILLVEDETLVRDTLSAAMERKGHTVVTATNGIQGLRKFDEDRFDLVLTDIIMPDMEGMGMIMEMRRKVPNLKVIAMSGGGRTGTIEYLKMARKLGAKACLKKPFRLAELFGVLDESLREARHAIGQ